MIEYKAGLRKLQEKISAILHGLSVRGNNSVRQQNVKPAAVSSNEVLPLAAAVSCVTASVPQRQQPEKPPPKTEVAGKETRFFAVVRTFGQVTWQKIWEQIHNKLLAPKPGGNVARQKSMTILVPVLFVVFVFVVIRVFAGPSHRISKKDTGTERASVVGGSNNEIDWHLPEPCPSSMRDPMQLGAVPVTQGETDKLIVKGIVYSEDASSAIVGNQIVHAGEEVLGVKVVKINKDSIEFELNGKRWMQKVQK